MDKSSTYIVSDKTPSIWMSKLSDYVMLTKFKLSLVVVISSLLGYLIVAGSDFNLTQFLILGFGGFLVTGAANALNQVLEKDYDVLMTRTANRPVATGRMKTSEGVMVAGISCLIGITLLATFNHLTALLGMISLILYAFVYTPLKRYSTLAVPVGAIPGALPVLIGTTAFSGTISLFAICLFMIQFLWQFPHFWSIGFVGYEDYQKAGYKLLPERDGMIDRNLGLSSMFYALMILPLAASIFIRLDTSLGSFIFVSIMTFSYIFFAYNFHKKFDKASALKLMFFSFFYLPLVLLAYWLI